MKRLEQCLTVGCLLCQIWQALGKPVCLQGLLQPNEARQTLKYLLKCHLRGRGGKGLVGRRNSLCTGPGGAQCVQRLGRALCGGWNVGRNWGEMTTESEVGMRLQSALNAMPRSLNFFWPSVKGN